ncbi:MAG: alpha/beta hydrolase [Parasphingorhabdus sp.]
MRMEQHLLNELHSFRFTGEDPKYALVISHGIASHAGIYDVFCEHHAEKGADIWSFDAPGHGRSTTNRPRGQWRMEEWVQASMDYATHVKELTGLPVFTLGSSLGVGAAISSISHDDVTGAILMGSTVVPGHPMLQMMATPFRSEEWKAAVGLLRGAGKLDIGRFFNFDEDYGYAGALEQKKADPWNTWDYDLESWASLFQYDPPKPIAENDKPVLYTVGENDPTFPVEMVKAVAGGIGGPVDFEVFDGAGHQLMLFHTAEFSNTVHEWALKQI